MDYLQFDELPDLRQPTVIAVFQGWNDAGEAASTAVRFLIESWSASPFGSVDAEEFFDFTVSRPLISIGPDEQRSLEWPANRFFYRRGPESGGDVVLLLGTEPHLRWRTFTGALVEFFRRLDGSRLVTLGGLVGDSVHTRPAPVTGFASESEMAARLAARTVSRTRYQGPTGIVGVLHDACRRAGLPALSLWVSVPPYLGSMENPKAALALLETLDHVLGLGLKLGPLIGRSRSFENQVSAAVAGNDEVKAYVEELEGRIDAGLGAEESTPGELPTAGEIIGDLEDFLRRQRGDA